MSLVLIFSHFVDLPFLVT